MNDSIKQIAKYIKEGGAYIDLIFPESNVDKTRMKPVAVLTLTAINGNTVNRSK